MSDVMKKLAVAGLCLLAASEAGAQELRLHLGGSDAAVTDDAYDYLGEGTFLSLSQLGAEIAPLEGLFFGLEYQWGASAGSAVESLDTTLDIDGLLLTGRYEYAPLSFLAVYGGLGGGFYHLELDATLVGEAREQDRFTGVFQGALGAEVYVPRGILGKIFGLSRRDAGGDLTVGFLLEVGYRLALEADFDKLARPEPDKEPEPEDRPLEAAALDLGSLDLSGVMMRAALTLRF
jgi:hypothetical protein